MFGSPSHWKQAAKGDHVDWYCDYACLRKPLQDALTASDLTVPNPRLLLLGTGSSTFADEMYDGGGFKDVLVLDCHEAPLKRVKARAAGSRQGLATACCDAALEAGPGSMRGVLEGHATFHAVVDKGLLDCLLCSPEGGAIARRAIAAVYERMSTPAVWVSVSHSPPRERTHLYNSVYWHALQVYSVRSMPTEAVLTAAGVQEWTPQPCNLGVDDDVGFDVLTAYIYVMTK